MEGQKKAFSVFLQLQRIEPVGATKGVLKQQTTGKFLHRYQLLAR
jgi:hypothetical protein